VTANVSVQGSTTGRSDTANEASCGFGGGNGAPDAVYEYVAPAAGTYEVQVLNAAFEPYLYVRANSCLATEAELGCTSQAGGTRDRKVELGLGAGQRIAIVVDGVSGSGDFTLRVQRRLPDLVVTAVSANPSTAAAGGSTTVSAVILNRGDAAAGAFTVDVLLARDAGGLQPVSLSPLRVLVSDGLAAGTSREVELPNPFQIPLLAPHTLFVVARADGLGRVPESDERNNANSSPITLTQAPGAMLEQRQFRAEDGTVYQLIQARPVTDPTESPRAAQQFRVTTIAGSSETVETCETAPTGLGTRVGAAVGTAALVDLGAVRRSAILRPNVFTAPQWEAIGGGRLRLGAGAVAIEICADPSTCAGAEPLVPVTEASGGLPAACAARLESGSYCADRDAPAAISFGLAAAADGECSDPSSVTVHTTACFGAGTVRGFDLLPGEAVVFVYEAGREAFAVGSAAFGFAPSQVNSVGCATGASDAPAFRGELAPAAPLVLRQRIGQGQGGVDGLSNARSVTVSPDGAHIYVVILDAVAVFRRDPGSAALIFAQVMRQGQGGVDGLGGARNVTVSPDGSHIYVASDLSNAVAVFARDTGSGALTLAQVVRQLQGGVDGLDGASSVAVSPDGAHVYVTSRFSRTIAVFGRDEGRGTLTFAQVLRQGQGGVDGLDGAQSVAVSPDGANVYVASESDAVAVFSREAGSGALTFTQVVREGQGGVDGLDGAQSITVSPDGAHVYVTGALSNAMAVFERDGSGRLTFVQVVRQGQFGVNGLDSPRSVTVSSDGAQVFVVSSNAVAVFGRQAASGVLFPGQVVREGQGGVDGLDGANSVTVSPDGAHVYVASTGSSSGVGALAVFGRDGIGRLTFAQVVRRGQGGVDGLENSQNAAVSPDGAHVYVASSSPGAVAVFGRDARSGRLTFTQVVRQGEDGVDGLDVAVSVAMSPDGAHVYVASNSSLSNGGLVAVFRRDPMSGVLTFTQLVRQAQSGIDRVLGAQSVTVSPDGAHAYTASRNSNAVAVFQRDTGSGALTMAQVVRQGQGEVDGLVGAQSVTVSPDGAHVYVASVESRAVAVFVRDPVRGVLTFTQVVRQGEDGVDGLVGANSVTVSPDGAHVYVASDIGAVVVFGREAGSGTLTLTQVVRQGQGGVDGLLGAASVTVSPDSAHVYLSVTDAVFVFKRDQGVGALTIVQVVRDGIFSPVSLTLSPEGSHCYVADFSAVAVFAVTEVREP
jgi:6-phosphogluconolactonase (cycloisomerase 2 family)